MAAPKSAWSGNLKYGIKWRRYFPEIAGKMRGVLPEGKYRQLRRAINIDKMRKYGEYGMAIDIENVAYARISDIGGPVPERFAREKRCMMWRGRGGEKVFAHRAKGFDVTGLNWSQAGLSAFLKSIDYQDTNLPLVAWADN